MSASKVTDRAPVAGSLLFLVILFTPGVTWGQAEGEGFAVAHVTGERVYLRTGPSKNHFPFTQLSRGDQVIVTGQQGEWSRVQLPAYRECWIHGDYVEASGDGAVRVTGTSVRLRATPGINHAPIGQVRRGRLLQATGQKDKTDTWLRVRGPLGASAYIHRDYIRHDRKIGADDVAGLFPTLLEKGPGLAAVGPAGEGTPKGASASGQSGLAVYVSPRMQAIQKKLEAERLKPPRRWNLEPLVLELTQIRESTEDAGEAELAQELIRTINDQLLPVQATLRELDRKQVAARELRETGEKKDQEASDAVRKRPGRRNQDYLSVGWVVAQGKHRKANSTHKLMKGNKTLYFLRSDQIDLDKYVHRRVGLQGTIEDLPPDLGVKLIVVTGIKVLSE